jgi:hypothetical protein
MSRGLPLAALATLVCSLTVCASDGRSSPGGSFVPGESFALSVGQQTLLPDAATLRYIGIANDSRCPPKVQCIRAGDADVLFDFTASGAAPARVTLNTERARTANIGAWRLQLLALAPGALPHATLRIDARETGAPP